MWLGRALQWWAVGQAQGPELGMERGRESGCSGGPMRRGSGHMWLGLRCPAKSFGWVSSSSSQHLLSDHSVPGTSQGAEL